MEGVNDFIDTWCNKDVVYESVLTDWKYNVISKADRKTDILKTHL